VVFVVDIFQKSESACKKAKLKKRAGPAGSQGPWNVQVVQSKLAGRAVLALRVGQIGRSVVETWRVLKATEWLSPSKSGQLLKGLMAATEGGIMNV
jgi:hypothetical protein